MIEINPEQETFGLFQLSPRDLAVDRLHAATAIYTTAAVIDPLLRRSGWPNRELSLWDPSCGDGAFLVGALRQASFPVNDIAAIAGIRGWEIHPQAVEQARMNVAAQLVSSGWRREIAQNAAHQMVAEEDFLLPSRPIERATLIAGNPPYLRYANLPEYFKAIYGDVLPDHARADLLHAFLDRCCALLPDDGAIAFVTADRWLFNSGAAGLRETLGRYLGIDHVCRLDCSTSFYRPKTRRAGELPRVWPVEVVLRNRSVALQPLSKEPVYPDDLGPEEEARNEPQTGGRTLADICDITIGPYTGPFGIFVVDAAKAKTLPPEYLLPAVDTDDLDFATGGIRNPSKFVIVTERDRCPVESVAAHLRNQIHRMPQRGVRSDGRYWIPPEKIPEHLDKPRLVVPRIARELKAVVVPAGVVPINHNLSVCATRGLDLESVRRILTSERSQAWFKRTADRLEGGYFSVKTTTLRRMPV